MNARETTAASNSSAEQSSARHHHRTSAGFVTSMRSGSAGRSLSGGTGVGNARARRHGRGPLILLPCPSARPSSSPSHKAPQSADRSAHLPTRCARLGRIVAVLPSVWPCFQAARLDLANPSGVRGPVLAPPCMRHRPFLIAADLQGASLRVRAPQRGAFNGSPGGLPFFSHPNRDARGSSVISPTPSPPVLRPADGSHIAHSPSAPTAWQTVWKRRPLPPASQLRGRQRRPRHPLTLSLARRTPRQSRAAGRRGRVRSRCSSQQRS
jgi:hypothetical protein